MANANDGIAGSSAPWVVSVMLTAVVMSAGFAHLLALPNKIGMERDAYLTAQQIYRGWELLGIVIIAALIATAALAVSVRRSRRQFVAVAIAAALLGSSLVVFFLFTFPANQATEAWTMLPANWEGLRRQWEMSHAVNAIIYFLALGALVVALARRRSARE